MEETKEIEMSFWDHLDELKKVLLRMIIVVLAITAVIFFFKEEVFRIVLAPHRSDFILYQLFNQIGEKLNITGLVVENFNIELINIDLASQFFIHITTSIYFGILIASPYIIYEIVRFIAPALHTSERQFTIQLVFGGFVLFIAGILLNYFLIFPLSFRFLSTYQISDQIVNTVSIRSYMSTFTTLSWMMGLAFEIPILLFFLAKLDIISADLLRSVRKHAFVVILVLSAIITPTSDVFTLLIVGLPIYLLYEFSILLIRRKTIN